MASIDIPETPREQRYDWSGFVVTDTLDEIERRFRNLFTHGRGWTRISWYEHAWANSPEIDNGLFLDDDPQNFKPPIHRDDQSVTVWLTHATIYSVGTDRVATEEEARKRLDCKDDYGDHQSYTIIEFDGGAREGEQGRGDRVKITYRNTHGVTRHIILISEHTPCALIAEQEARVIEAVADRMQDEDNAWGDPGIKFVRGLAERVRAYHYPLTWEK